MLRKRSEHLFAEAKTLFPGGVSSPVRAFRSVTGAPLFMKEGRGCYITDEDDNTYIDYCCSWGPLILGHAPKNVIDAVQQALVKGTSFGTPTQYENILGKLIIDNHRYIEKLRFVSSGTEAVMSAIRLARGYTKKNKIIKFEGCYHGHSDSLLVKAGSGLVTLGETSSLGIPIAFANETIVLELDDETALSEAIRQYKDEIACVIIEPVPANNGLLLQRKEYLQFIRDITAEHNILLIYDEVISGFRLGFEGAAATYGITPDIITFGKIIGGGLPVGAYGASAEIMRFISPDGGVYQAGTLSGNPLSISAGIAQLSACLEKDFYAVLEQRTKHLADHVSKFAADNKIPVTVLSTGSIFWITFAEDHWPRRAADIDPATMEKFKHFHYELLQQGIYIGPSGYEVCFVSAAHTDEIIEETVKKMCAVLRMIYQPDYNFNPA